MSLLADLASGTSALLFGPPPPVQKHPPPSPPTAPSPWPAHTSIKSALLSPHLGLSPPRTMTSPPAKKTTPVPPPAPPSTEPEPPSIIFSIGVSAINLLGTAVVELSGVALSALITSTTPDDSDAPSSPAASPKPQDDSAVPSSPPAPSPKPPQRSSSVPVQLTATGEPFSSDPSISAMQRIPDHPCGHALPHSCSAPDVLHSVPECGCPCAVGEENESCDCSCHARKGQSGHFHRVEQIVKGTKRVVRDIKNVL